MIRLLLSLVYGLIPAGIFATIYFTILHIIIGESVSDIEGFFLIVGIVITILIYLYFTITYYQDYTPPSKKETIIELSTKSIDLLNKVPSCVHCKAKGLCNCKSCSSKDENLVGDIKKAYLVDYRNSDYSTDKYYKCSVCSGAGVIQSNQKVQYKTTINTDVEDYDEIRTLQDSTASRILKEIELVEMKKKQAVTETEKEMELLDKQLELEKLRLSVYKERKFSFFDLFRKKDS